MPKDKIITHGRGLQAAWNVLPKNLDARHARDCRGQRERGRRVFSIVEQGPLQPLCMKKFGHLLARQFFRTAIRFAFASGSEMRVLRIPRTFSPISFRLGRRDAGRRRLSRCWGRCPLARYCPGMASDCPCLDLRCWPLSPAGGIRLRAIGAHMTANSSRIGKFLTVPEMDGLDGRFNPPPSLPCRAHGRRKHAPAPHHSQEICPQANFSPKASGNLLEDVSRRLLRRVSPPTLYWAIYRPPRCHAAPRERISACFARRPEGRNCKRRRHTGRPTHQHHYGCRPNCCPG